MTVQKALEDLSLLQEKISAYSHASSMIFYDGATAAPKGTAGNRARTLAVLSEEKYKLMTGPETEALLAFLSENTVELDPTQKRTVELMNKEILNMKKIPMDEYVAFQRLLSDADAVWHEAKEKSDFPMFEGILAEIFETNKRFAGYIAPDKHPYDYWLGEFEDGLTMADCDKFFDTLRSELVPLIKAIGEKEQIDSSFLEKGYSVRGQEELSEYLMDVIKLDRAHCALSTTEHPFTISLGGHEDVRITTNYRDNVCSSMYSVVHEGGHALYMMGVGSELNRTVLDDGPSMSLHESQSRFYENLIGRSRAFVSLITPKLHEIFPAQLSGKSAEDIYRAANRSEPSLIRIEADELTYSLHIMVRYEIEKMMMNGDITVHDIPAQWNRLYKEYLDVDVPDDRRGCLQDSHWSGGSVGYFPSYALGSAYGVQFLGKMKESVDVDGCIRKGDLSPINEWNKEHIWQYGSLYKPAELLQKVLGEPFDPLCYTNYLKEKYKDIYEL